MSPMALQSASIVGAPMRLRWTLSLAKTISIGSGLDIGVEDLAVHGLVDHPRRGQAIATQSGNEGLGGRRAGHADLLRGDLRLDLEDDLLGPPPTLRRRGASSAHSCGRYELASRMLFTKVDSWFMGINTNVPGKQKGTFLLYSGGAQLTARNATR